MSTANTPATSGARLVRRSTSGPLPTSTLDLVSDAGEVLGFTQIRRCPSHGTDLPHEAANHVYYQIAEAHRGQGHGKALLELALIEAKRLGLERVRLTCMADNPASRRIIECNGGIYIGELRSKQGEQFRLFEISL